MITEEFQSEKYDHQGEFLLSLSADDYNVVMHALVVAGGVMEETKGTDASLIYDGLHDRLTYWNDCDIEPFIEGQT
tara:strand:- start:862 stop:1089 length:228 start_codon:yes stop_codon:yes gene_type:complete